MSRNLIEFRGVVEELGNHRISEFPRVDFDDGIFFVFPFRWDCFVTPRNTPLVVGGYFGGVVRMWCRFWRGLVLHTVAENVPKRIKESLVHFEVFRSEFLKGVIVMIVLGVANGTVIPLAEKYPDRKGDKRSVSVRNRLEGLQRDYEPADEQFEVGRLCFGGFSHV